MRGLREGLSQRSRFPSLHCPRCLSSRYGQGGARGTKERKQAEVNPTDKDMQHMEASAWRTALAEMGDAEEDDLLERVAKLKQERLDELFPDAYKPKNVKRVIINEKDPWENGTVVRVMARVLALLLALAGLYAFRDQIMGKEVPGRIARGEQKTA